jgi:plastocyanin
MSAEDRRRVTLGVGIPLGAFLFLALLIFAFSRILLAVPETLAPWVALLFAVNILVGCALAATIRGTRGFVFLITVLVATILGGGIAGAVLGERPIESHVAEEGAQGEHAAPPGEEAPPPGEGPASGEGPAPGKAPAGQKPPAKQPPAPGGTIPLVAESLAFDTPELALPAGGEVTIAFDNKDAGIPHNVALYTEQGGDPIFQGELVTGPTTAEYRFPAPDPGTYYFQCDVHPTMNGSAVVG